MRQPVKMMEVYQKLKKAIEYGVYPGGFFLPREVILAQKLGISRDTLRAVLTKLSDEKLIERMCPKGTMVCNRPSKIKQPLSFLLPCANFLAEGCSYVESWTSRRIHFGLSQIAFDNDYRVETVPVSPTNNEHEIDLRKLDFVNANSMLVVNGDWFRDLFPLLLERGCRMVFVYSHLSRRKADEDFINRCFRIKINSSGAAESMVEYFFRHGCRRIALFHRFISEPEHPTMGGYLSGLRKCGLTFTAWREPATEQLTQRSLKIQLRDFYEKSGGFDSLIVDPVSAKELLWHRNLYDIGLSEDIKIIISNDFANNPDTSSLSSMIFPYEEIGRIAARHLLSPDFSPGEQLINGRLIEHKATFAQESNLALV